MQSNNTVILGEASESDSEEIPLGEDYPTSTNIISTGTATTIDAATTKNGKNMFSSSIFNSISTTSTLARLANYSPYNLLNPIVGTQNQDKSNPKNFMNQLPPLHRTLYTKNQQLYACLAHVYRHPYEKANKDIQSINQRLVKVQKNIQQLDIEVMKIKREEKNLDLIVNLIA